MKKSLSVLALSALGVSMLAGPAFAGHEGSRYTATLNALNGETGSGTAEMQVDENDGSLMTVTVEASNLELDFVHALHVHGVFNDGASITDDPNATAPGNLAPSACPTLAQDTGDANGGDPEPDGFVSVIEGAATYGGVLISLTESGETTPGEALAVSDFQSGTSISYEREITIPTAIRAELGEVHIVVHGTDTDDSGDVSTEADENGDSTKFSTLDQSLPFDATAPALCGTFTVASAGAVQTGAGGTATNGSTALVLGAGGLALAGAVALRRRGEVA